MAVLVMEMVDALSSGVMYTSAPDEAESGILEVHSVHGLGELLVQGEVNADRFRVVKGDPPAVCTQETAAKRHRMVAGAAGDARIEGLPEQVQRRPTRLHA